MSDGAAPRCPGPLKVLAWRLPAQTVMAFAGLTGLGLWCVAALHLGRLAG